MATKRISFRFKEIIWNCPYCGYDCRFVGLLKRGWCLSKRNTLTFFHLSCIKMRNAKPTDWLTKGLSDEEVEESIKEGLERARKEIDENNAINS